MTASILYIHGFNSAPESLKASQLQRAMKHLGVAERLAVPALHHHPRQAIEQLEQQISALGQPLLVGSSLGGYYATYLAERHNLSAVLINPAVRPHLLFEGYLGPQTNFYTQETWQLTTDHVNALAELEVQALNKPERYQVWLQSGDETLDYRHAAEFYQHTHLQIEQGGDHSYQGFALRLPGLLAFAGFPHSLCHGTDFSVFN